MKTRLVRHGMTLAVLLCAAAAAQADDQDQGRYIMAVFSDMAQGRAILDGSPDPLIDELEQDQSGETFSIEENINLCVAYTQAKQVADATSACNAAVELSAKQAKRTGSGRGSVYSLQVHQARTNRAIALSNRGVLHALRGEYDVARKLFEESLALDSRRTHVRTNLSLLEEDLMAAN